MITKEELEKHIRWHKQRKGIIEGIPETEAFWRGWMRCLDALNEEYFNAKPQKHLFRNKHNKK